VNGSKGKGLSWWWFVRDYQKIIIPNNEKLRVGDIKKRKKEKKR
jgi:hypothetical protein